MSLEECFGPFGPLFTASGPIFGHAAVPFPKMGQKTPLWPLPGLPGDQCRSLRMTHCKLFRLAATKERSDAVGNT